jgi:hypothetical protein
MTFIQWWASKRGETAYVTEVDFALMQDAYRAGQVEEREACGWRKIETVPRDGSSVLVYLRDKHRFKHIHTANYHSKGPAVIGGMYEFDLSPAIYWMPEPNAPKNGESE